MTHTAPTAGVATLPEWFTAKQYAAQQGTSVVYARANLRRLLKAGEVTRRAEKVVMVHTHMDWSPGRMRNESRFTRHLWRWTEPQS